MTGRNPNFSNIPALKTRRKEPRNNPTAAEVVLWKHLQRRQILGKKFRRQFSLGRYIVDFFCDGCDIAIELDGAPHYRPLRNEHEAERTEFLESLGIQVLRFENRIVHQNIDAFWETIAEAVKERGRSEPPRPR